MYLNIEEMKKRLDASFIVKLLLKIMHITSTLKLIRKFYVKLHCEALTRDKIIKKWEYCLGTWSCKRKNSSIR